jgi:putative membrane protein
MAALLFGLGTLCLALRTPAAAAPTKSRSGYGTKAETTMSAMDRDFVAKAAQGGMMEVKLGKTATQHAASDAVKQFGQRMVQDHGKANSELKQLARQKGFALPKSMDSEHQAMISQLSKLTGGAFDQQYAKQMVEDHEKDVALFEKEAAEGSDPDLKAWAAKTLPTLREHLQMARNLPGAGQTPERSTEPGR